MSVTVIQAYRFALGESGLTTRLVREHGSIVVEDLNVAGKRRPGTVPADQTGTVPPQGGIAYHELTNAH